MNFKDLLEKHTLKCIAGGFVLGVAAIGVTNFFLHFSGTKTFCGQCHSMKHEAATFAVSSHREQDCVECHLPHDNFPHYLIEKGRTGMVDMYHEVIRDYPAKIKLSNDARKMVSENCLRCHESTMSYVSTAPGGSQDDCLKCHSRIAHGSNHLEGGIQIE
ncbi:MAG: NapC/NirT family cytochrome c [Selenomonadaceae bacterium]|nr:NapC/NirT family cytochrome c [Selenomonadaceae bacterium]